MKNKSENQTIKCDLCGYETRFKSLVAEIVYNKRTIGYLCVECAKTLIYKEDTPYIKIIK